MHRITSCLEICSSCISWSSDFLWKKKTKGFLFIFRLLISFVPITFLSFYPSMDPVSLEPWFLKYATGIFCQARSKYLDAMSDKATPTNTFFQEEPSLQSLDQNAILRNPYLTIALPKNTRFTTLFLIPMLQDSCRSHYSGKINNHKIALHSPLIQSIWIRLNVSSYLLQKMIKHCSTIFLLLSFNMMSKSSWFSFCTWSSQL